MKVVERLLEKRLRRLVKVDQMQLGFMPGKSTVDAIFILSRIQESYLEKNRKLFICFVDLEKAFDRVPRKVIEKGAEKEVGTGKVGSGSNVDVQRSKIAG